MKRSTVTGLSFFTALCVFVLSGCPASSPVSPGPGLPDGTVIEQNSTLFAEDSAAGVVSFTTNDTRYNGQYGYTLWTEEAADFTPFTHLNVTLSKMSGNDAAGYGVLFCSRDDSMLIVLINTRKEYLIGELTGNAFTPIGGWQESADLVPGYNVTNILDITLDPETGTFVLAFNSGDPVTFRDDEEPYHTGGRNGYMVVVSPIDDFPDIPVSVTFKNNEGGK